MTLFPVSFGASVALSLLIASRLARYCPKQFGWGSFGNLGFRKVGGGKIPY